MVVIIIQFYIVVKDNHDISLQFHPSPTALTSVCWYTVHSTCIEFWYVDLLLSWFSVFTLVLFYLCIFLMLSWSLDMFMLILVPQGHQLISIWLYSEKKNEFCIRYAMVAMVNMLSSNRYYGIVIQIHDHVAVKDVQNIFFFFSF